MNRPRAFTTATILILFGLGACGGRSDGGGGGVRDEQQGRVGDAQEEPARMEWTVRMGSQGGFTGGGSGYVVQGDGLVQSWSRITPQDEILVQSLGRAAPDRLRELDRTLADPRLQALHYLKSGNLTGFLELRQGDAVRRYTWPERVGELDVPEELRAAVEAARAAVQSARP